VGTLIAIPGTISDGTAELACFDCVICDLEHGENEFPGLSFAVVSFSGSAGVMLPRISRGSELDLALSALDYPPVGIQGVASYNRSGSWRPNKRTLAEAKPVAVVQVETKCAADCPGEIAQNPRVDAVLVGPFDPSFILGVATVFEETIFCTPKWVLQQQRREKPFGSRNQRVDPLPDVVQELEGYVSSGAEVLMLAALTGREGYDDARPVLTDQKWRTMYKNLDRITSYAAEHSVTAVMHLHVGTMAETKVDVEQVLARSTMPFCLDTGHMLIGGTDPISLSREHVLRIRHSHLKDVNLAVAQPVRVGEIACNQGVLQGPYTPLGHGGVGARAIIENMLSAGYAGWFDLEQDSVIDSDSSSKPGPFQDAKANVEFINSVVAEVA
jgi:inosose dehydratase